MEGCQRQSDLSKFRLKIRLNLMILVMIFQHFRRKKYMKRRIIYLFIKVRTGIAFEVDESEVGKNFNCN